MGIIQLPEKRSKMPTPSDTYICPYAPRSRPPTSPSEPFAGAVSFLTRTQEAIRRTAPSGAAPGLLAWMGTRGPRRTGAGGATAGRAASPWCPGPAPRPGRGGCRGRGRGAAGSRGRSGPRPGTSTDSRAEEAEAGARDAGEASGRGVSSDRVAETEKERATDTSPPGKRGREEDPKTTPGPLRNIQGRVRVVVLDPGLPVVISRRRRAVVCCHSRAGQRTATRRRRSRARRLPAVGEAAEVRRSGPRRALGRHCAPFLFPGKTRGGPPVADWIRRERLSHGVAVSPRELTKEGRLRDVDGVSRAGDGVAPSASAVALGNRWRVLTTHHGDHGCSGS